MKRTHIGGARRGAACHGAYESGPAHESVSNHRRTLLRTALAAALIPATAVRAFAQRWPDRPIKWVVPYAAGTGPDNTARIIAESVSRSLGRPVVIENRAGAAGNIGARLVANAPGDGYTWIYSAAPMAANMLLYANPGYDAIKDFRHVARISSSDTLLVVPADSHASTTQALIERMRASPGRLDYASGGVGTPSHLGVEMMLGAAKVKATHVPYKGAGESVNAVLGHQVDFAMPIFSVAYPFVKSGLLRALAVCGQHRNPVLPGVPLLSEAGVPGVSLESWGGVSVPAGTPDAIVSAIAGAVQQSLREPAVIRALELNGGRAAPANGGEYIKAFEREMDITRRVMQKTGLQPL
jgi:tripartite-type tricarboxylate transporter receptor subunit TctC